jgi:type II secretory pathway pseudopilin PulG
MTNMVLIGMIIIEFSLLACTPSATSNSQKANQDSAQSATQSSAQSAALGHREDTQSIPINVLCVQVFSDAKTVSSGPCFQRGGSVLPGDNMLGPAR